MKPGHNQRCFLARSPLHILTLAAWAPNGVAALKLRVLLVTSAVLFSITTSRADLVISGLYNTGVDNAGTVRAAGLTELHYSVVGPENVDQAYIELVVYHNHTGSQAWVTPPAGSAWIGPNQPPDTYPDCPVGDYTYTASFNIAGGDPSNLVIQGVWASDDSSQIWVNGVYTGLHKEGWPSFIDLTPFSLGGFVEGNNTIQFKVNNAVPYPPVTANPSGLLVAFEGIPILPIPEPSTFIAGALLLLPLAVRVCGGRALMGERQVIERRETPERPDALECA